MSEPETPLPNVSPQLANIQNSLFSVIENSKKQQWTITNYVILVYAAIFGLSQVLKPIGDDPRRRTTGLLFAAHRRCEKTSRVIYRRLLQMQWDLETHRKQTRGIATQRIGRSSGPSGERYQIQLGVNWHSLCSRRVVSGRIVWRWSVTRCGQDRTRRVGVSERSFWRRSSALHAGVLDLRFELP